MEKLAQAGGLFSLLVFVHFVADWIFQSHREAMAKHRNAAVRAIHCLVYTLVFVPVMHALGFGWGKMAVGAAVLYISHFVEDTYIPVMLWAKYMRHPPEMDNPDIRAGFESFVSTPLGKILAIVVDQLIHLCFLWFLVWLALKG